MEKLHDTSEDELEWIDKGSGSDATRDLIVELLARIDAVRRTKGWSEGYFGKVAGGDDGVVQRLRVSGRITAKNIARIEQYLSEMEDAQ